MSISDVKFAGFGAPNSEDNVLKLLSFCSNLGAESSYVTSPEESQFANFNHGEIDWRELTFGIHWLVNSAQTTLLGDSPRSAWGAGMTIGELEGARVVMLIDIPINPSQLAEAWGSVIERIRQIHVLFFTPAALAAISKIEEIPEEKLLHEIRLRGLTPHVCSYNPDQRMASIEHALGSTKIETKDRLESLEWLARYLSNLPSAGTGIAGVESAAQS
jgi:hypothetical protein